MRIGVALPCLTFILSAPLAAQFVPAGQLLAPRADLSTVELGNGSVLVAGGQKDLGGYTGPIQDSEIFTLSLGTTRRTGAMKAARFGHTLTRLEDGRILATGGSYADSRMRYAVSPTLASAEIYNPTTGKWTLTGSMKQARAHHDAVLLPSGKVLVGGASYSLTGGSGGFAEIFNPATGKFTATGQTVLQRRNAKLVGLQDGRVLILGTADGDDVQSRTAEIYNPRTGTFSIAGTMTVHRSARFAATLLQDGRVLVSGGDADTSKGGTLEIFNPSTATFTFLGYLSTDREGHNATLMQDGSVLISGGHGVVNRTPGPNPGFVPPITGTLASVERFFTYTMSAEPLGQLLTPRSGHTGYTTARGSVLLLGGSNAQVGGLGSVEALPVR